MPAQDTAPWSWNLHLPHISPLYWRLLIEPDKNSHQKVQHGELVTPAIDFKFHHDFEIIWNTLLKCILNLFEIITPFNQEIYTQSGLDSGPNEQYKTYRLSYSEISALLRNNTYAIFKNLFLKFSSNST